MKLPVLLIAVVVVLSGAAQAADKACPAFAPGELYPWQTSEIMPGDEWAELYIDLDAKGRPTNCRIGKHKLSKEMGFWMCRAAMAQSKFNAVMKDGIPVAGTVTQSTFMPGRKHREVDAAARKKFFKDNPHERPKCYPE